MSAYRDLCNPTEPHVVRMDGVHLEFADGGLLRAPTAEQVAAMTATLSHRERFVSVTAPVADVAPAVADVSAAAPAASEDAGIDERAGTPTPAGRRHDRRSSSRGGDV